MRISSMIRLRLALACCIFALAGGVLSAQPGGPKPVPTVPGSQSAGSGGYTSSQPSTGAGSAIGPLEPYLVTLLIPGFGIIAAVVAIAIDRRMRFLGHGGK